MDLEPVIGFEVHAQLATRSKIFCACPNEPGAPPNTLVCPVCLGLPGALPALNDAALDLGIRAALALDAAVSRRTSFARKNYFYPDLPKGYQITQFGEPLGTEGHLDVEGDRGVRRVRVRQVHLEEDAGKTIHTTTDGKPLALVDMNRCGVPLVEVVTEPDIRSLAEAEAFLVALHRLLVFGGVTRGRMHMGELRFDANVSVRAAGSRGHGRSTEIKNLNSFRAAQKALAFEIDRQGRLVKSGEGVVHETLLWDDAAGRALAMRSKEREHDYRYFPEPDLPPVSIDDDRIRRARASLPELPGAMRARFVASYGIAPYDADVLTSDPGAAACFELTLEEVLRALRPGPALDGAGPADDGAFADVARTVGKWVSVIAPGILGALDAGVRPPADRAGDGHPDGVSRRASLLASVLVPHLRGEVSESAAKTLLARARETGEPVELLIDRLGLSLLSDERVLRDAVRNVLDRNPEEVARYRRGELKLLRFFMGEVMKDTGGAADPAAAGSILEDELAGRE